MDVIAALLDSWDRQCRIVEAAASRVDESNRKFKPTPDGWALDMQLAHVHTTRRWFLSNVAPEVGKALPETMTDGWETPIEDLDAIKAALKQSGQAIRQVLADAFAAGTEKFGWYDNPVMFLQHMVWHEGWHVGMIFLALRVNGQEPPEEWEVAHVWDEWRKEEWE